MQQHGIIDSGENPHIRRGPSPSDGEVDCPPESITLAANGFRVIYPPCRILLEQGSIEIVSAVHEDALVSTWDGYFTWPVKIISVGEKGSIFVVSRQSHPRKIY